MRRARAVAAWLIVLPWAAWATVRLGGFERGFPIVPVLAYTPYAVVGAAMALALAALLRVRVAAAVALVSVAALVGAVAPRAIAQGADVDGAPLRVLTANVSYGHVPAAYLTELVRRERVDVLSVVELTPELAAALERAGLTRDLPHRVLRPGPGASGTGIYSRRPLRALTAPQPTRHRYSAALVGDVEFYAVHPPAPTSDGAVGQWVSELARMPGARASARLRVLAGDFNATLDHEALRGVLATGYADAADRAGAGLRGTWPSGRRVPPPVTIDHVLVSERAGVRAVRVHDLPGSDHRAVFAELVLPRE